ncbi:MAG: aminotransferase class I/II-fold pyridoxal phosphate-dependent enzyme [Saprospiraceae bacterium]|nr:GntG family PLP-dependent aldolase [Candidatus Brachybacter algidus]MBK8747727.1 aminotransferase class I/II-fold pyridoxal phosphate-dependent enzyme [Candidatus Brachybacter algidus]
MINLISDTVTKPSREMLEYMMSAELGDDVFGEDPTVNALQEKVAKMFGMEDALFCPSGTMTNQIAIKVHTRPLDEMICDQWSHVYQYEVGGYAFHSGIAVNPLIGKYGKITASQIEEAIKPEEDWLPRTTLVVLENSTNKGGGNYYTLDEIKPIQDLCDEKGLALHLDGARLMNVLVETGESTQDVGSYFDSISLCLSKGLGTPGGSILIGRKDFIKEARRVRKVMGGGMRQTGILAAAGIYALDNNIPQLKVDNDRAKILSNFLAQQPYVKEVLPVRTNILIFELANGKTSSDFINQLKSKGINAAPFGAHSVRFVLHRDITDGMIGEVMEILNREFLMMNYK